jgi:hypothetical protein
MKQELIGLVIGLWWLVLLGWLAPALLSMADNLAVLLGVAILLGSAYATYRYIRHRLLKHKAPNP